MGEGDTVTGVEPGEIIGWGGNGDKGHVIVYIGEPGRKFIDCPGPKNKVRVANHYGNGRKIYKMHY